MSNRNIIITVLVIIAVGVGLYIFSMGGGNSLSGGKVAATVNGEKITSSDFQAQLTRAKKMNLGLEEKKLKSEVLDQMIGNILIKQEAKEKGINVKESEVDARMNQVIKQAGGKEAFKKQLEKVGITKKELRKRAREQILVQNYMDSEISEDKLKVTNKEVKNYFDQMMSQQGNATNTPSFEEMEEAQKQQIKSQIRQQKRNQEIQKLIEKLKKRAEIEKSI